LVKDLHLTAVHVTHDQDEAVTIADRIALLREGRIEQVDTPLDFYNHPKTIFAANFLGGANLLEGVIKRVSAQGSLVDLGHENELHVSRHDYPKSRLIVLCTRLEKTKLRREPFKVNNLEGEVQATTFLGEFRKYDVKLDRLGETVSSRIPSKSTEQFNVGDKVYVHFDAEDCVVFPSPRHGLYKEIEVI
jgi:ABC-type Fe3+/spermidine/putrescine transport system ATPase subunit